MLKYIIRTKDTVINEIEYGEVIEWAKRLHELHYEMEENLNES